jgi:hypothetical protein
MSYYRLKQVDNDGQFAYSSVVKVDMDQQFEIFPNPSNELSALKLMGLGKNNEVLVTLYDLQGRELFSKVILTGNSGDTLIGFDPSTELEPGLYLITATSNQKIYKQRLIITEK